MAIAQPGEQLARSAGNPHLVEDNIGQICTERAQPIRAARAAVVRHAVASPRIKAVAAGGIGPEVTRVVIVAFVKAHIERIDRADEAQAVKDRPKPQGNAHTRTAMVQVDETHPYRSIVAVVLPLGHLFGHGVLDAHGLGPARQQQADPDELYVCALYHPFVLHLYLYNL